MGRIELPTPLITTPRFGGPDGDILFVASAALHVNYYTGDMGETLEYPAGSLFIIHGLGARGFPARKLRL